MANEFELSAQLRSDFGTRASRRLRGQNDQVPAVVYGTGQKNQTISLDHNKVTKALEHEAFFSHILTLHIDGKEEKVVLKDLQRHPYKPRVLHMDFLRVSMHEKLTMHVPLHFVGEATAPGIKAGGVVSHLINDLEIRCLPGDLPEFIEVDVSNLEMDQSVYISQISLPKGVELASPIEDDEHDHTVVNIHKPHVAAEEPLEATPVPTAAEAEAAVAAKESDAGEKSNKE